MKRNYITDIKKICFMWIFLCIMPFMAEGASNSFPHPDFAYPATVAENARKVLQRGPSESGELMTLRAAMQVVIAEDLVSESNAASGAALLDSLAGELDSPYSSLALLLEARLYADIYNSNRGRYNGRAIPVSPVPEDISEWSRDIFASKVCTLVERAFSSGDLGKNMPISAISGIITDSAEASRAGLSVYDFMTLRAVSCLETFSGAGSEMIPFFNRTAKGNRKYELSASSLMEKLAEENAACHNSNQPTEAGALMAWWRYQTISSDRDADYIESCIGRYGSTPYCARFLIAKYSGLSYDDDYTEAYRTYTEYLKKYPDCPDAAVLKNNIEDMTAKRVRINTSAQHLPGKEIKGEAKSRNMASFYLLAIKMGDSYVGKNIKKGELISGGTVAANVRLEGSTEIPGYKKQEFTLPPLQSGVYVIAASTTPDKGGLVWDANKNASLPTLLVSRIAVVGSSEHKENATDRYFYVVEGSNQKPVAGARVTFTPSWRNSGSKTTLTTDASGRVRAPKGNYDVLVKSGKDIYTLSSYTGGGNGRERKSLAGSIFTDLSIYHPGDEVGFAAVVYSKDKQELQAESGVTVDVILNDANYQGVDTLRLVSDAYGRMEGKFTLPEEGLLGGWSLQMMSGRNWLTQTGIEVAEYKSPTFYVAAEGTEGEVKIGDMVKIKGEARTYSGMPVANTDVRYQVTYTPCMWCRLGSGANANYGGNATTDGDGKFIIELPTAGLKGTRFAIGRYQLRIDVTDAAGETQQSPLVDFTLGRAYRISAQMPDYVDSGKEKEIKSAVAVYDMTGHPVEKKIFYRVIAATDSTLIAEGSIDSGAFSYPVSGMKPGKYIFRYSLNPGFKAEDGEQDAEAEVIVYSDSDRTPAVETQLWAPVKEIIVEPGARSVKVPFGSSYKDSNIYVETADINGVRERKWVKVSDGVTSIEVTAPADNDRVKVTLCGMHDLESRQATVTLVPRIQTRKVEIATETFRDKIAPGSNEEWKFRFSLDGKDLSSLPVMAVMSNKALNALAPFQWRFDPRSSLFWGMPGQIELPYIGRTGWNVTIGKNIYPKGAAYFKAPEWETYGYNLYGPGMVRYYKLANMSGVRVRGAVNTMDMADGVVESAEMVDEMKMAAPEAMAQQTGGAIKEEATENDGDFGVAPQEEETLREIECPLAFFFPTLVTDDKGVATVSFKVPDFNGTWQLQVMGYTSDMKTSVKTLDAVASKPVMASMNAPRFVRTGDRMSVGATVYNNSGDACRLGATAVVFNPITGKEYLTRTFEPEEVKAMGSRSVTFTFDIPSDIDMLGLRFYGEGGNARDGEQTVIPVYPSSTPVVESDPFYMAPGEKEMSMPLPARGKDGVATLTYSDNPIWECVTALPDILVPDSKNVLSQSYALYGNAIAAGLLKDYPQLMEALKLFADPANAADSTLVSNLQKNGNLKTVALNNTPWVRDAASETLRMSRLTEYADARKSAKAISDILASMSRLQNADGGWSWCENMRSSEWITSQVVLRFAMLEKMGYLPAAGKEMALKGIAYADRSIVEDCRKTGANKYSYGSLLNYLYVRSFFPKAATTPEFAEIKAKGIAAVMKGWKKYDIYEKATAATLLYREGKETLAGAILESLRQYSSRSAEKGMWFDNLKSVFGPSAKLITTAQVLEAYSEIQPGSECVDMLRQWLVLSKQTEDWGSNRNLAEAIQAILSSGSDWTKESPAPEIYIGEERIVPDRIARLTGNLTVSLSGKSGDLRVKRFGAGPAWGGVITQRVAPIEDVKAAKTPQISIEKNIYVISTDSMGTTASDAPLRKGDRVRVTLTIKCDRDVEYVAVTDSRSAALEPADQISGYTQSDGVWMYKEVGNSQTNLFIPFLSKGTHVISYECFVDREGLYTLGIATAQSQYAPVITAHSAGTVIEVK